MRRIIAPFLILSLFFCSALLNSRDTDYRPYAFVGGVSGALAVYASYKVSASFGERDRLQQKIKRVKRKLQRLSPDAAALSRAIDDQLSDELEILLATASDQEIKIVTTYRELLKALRKNERDRSYFYKIFLLSSVLSAGSGACYWYVSQLPTVNHRNKSKELIPPNDTTQYKKNDTELVAAADSKEHECPVCYSAPPIAVASCREPDHMLCDQCAKALCFHSDRTKGFVCPMCRANGDSFWEIDPEKKVVVQHRVSEVRSEYRSKIPDRLRNRYKALLYHWHKNAASPLQLLSNNPFIPDAVRDELTRHLGVLAEEYDAKKRELEHVFFQLILVEYNGELPSEDELLERFNTVVLGKSFVRYDE